MSAVVLFTIPKVENLLRYPLTDKGKKKMWYRYQNRVLSSYKRNENEMETLSFVTTWMKPKVIALCKINPLYKDKYLMISQVNRKKMKNNSGGCIVGHCVYPDLNIIPLYHIHMC